MKNLNDKELLYQIKTAVKNERDHIIIVLRHLKEIERRRLHLTLGFKSLFEYCHLELKYSRAESYARIACMRLMKEMKAVERKIEVGSISLTQAVDLFTAFNKNEKESGIKLSEEKKISLIEKIENSSTRESERILEKELKVESKQNETSSKNIKLDEKTYIELSKLGKDLDINDPVALIKFLIKEKSDEIKTEKQKEVSKATKIENEKSRYIPKQLKRDLLKAANYQCQFISKDGRRCSERVHLEVDHHRVPFSTGGRTVQTNLQIVCKNHNLKLAIDKLGVNVMKKYLRSI